MNQLILDPGTFRRLDILTRTEAGMPLHVFSWQKGIQCWGRAEQQKVLVLNVPTPDGYCSEMMYLIDIANRIDMDQFVKKSSHPWLDNGEIPLEKVYEWLVWHEIAHVKFGDMNAWEHFKKKGFQLAWREHLKWCTELRADRYAWGKIAPGKEMPSFSKTRESREAVKKFDATLKKYRNDFELLRRDRITPISTNPNEYVPWFHSEGLPFVQTVN
ncbi:hypothetical protein [Geomobilimonas luticola]|uniref:Uncharacterized protein n=1 Tax=Geomobilimonas luticola TaxID=1114878 RepID=A0ABS5SG54_9BACT|nr:hypothetical protein [Geomobilimonas luticola]MBT0654348.1 hypothetical protein [Geomobilimonas luticola]